MSDDSSRSSKLMLAVKADRFWNQHWRLLLFVGVVVLCSITGGFYNLSRSLSVYTPLWKLLVLAELLSSK